MKKKKLRVLVACEFSGQVRQAFSDRGWDAWSVDLLPSEQPGQHIVGDALKAIKRMKWDLIICHPPCQYLCNSGVRWLYPLHSCESDQRWELMESGASFFKQLWNARIPHIAIENPVMHKYANRAIFGEKGRKPDCTVQPWEHGHPEVKRTCFWTRNLPPLTPTNIVEGRQPRVHFCSPRPDRWKERSRTLPGIAKAMATIWGNHIEDLNK